ncbi:MAG: hypothetical protein IPK27_17265 [Rhodanobacteraceae bacterium]|nr:hypothetical protein [Rhodanobacteraceae bacterium]
MPTETREKSRRRRDEGGTVKANAKNNDFALKACVLLQVDLEGHSAWMANDPSKPDVARKRVEFAEQLRKSVGTNDFRLLSWKGDGGVYVASRDGRPNVDFAVDAAFAAAHSFSKWRKRAPSRSLLRLRVSIHLADDVYTHPQEGYWSSDDLNVFLKYERAIGVSGTIAITQAVHEHLSKGTQNRFNIARDRQFGAGGKPLISKIYHSSIPAEVALNRDDKSGFFEWINSLRLPGALTDDPDVGPESRRRLSLDGASFLFVAPDPDSELSLDLVARDSPATTKLTEKEDSAWREMQAKERAGSDARGDGRKVSALRVIQPLTDIPLAKIEYYVERWSRARSFHRLLEMNPPLRTRLAANVLDVQGNGLAHPGIAGCHMVIRTADAGRPHVLLCQRQTKGQDGAYHPGLWSISIEEQLQPSETIDSCVLRGLAEELLGQQGTAGVTSRVVGAVVEKSILNLSIIVLVDIPLTLTALKETWQTAIDKDEHCQVAALALDSGVLKLLANSRSLTREIRARMIPAYPKEFDKNDQWNLHPTALARAAMYAWAQFRRDGAAARNASAPA